VMRRAVRSLVQCVVVVLSFGAGIASAILAVRAVPPFEIAPRVTEGTPVQLVVFGSTFLVVVAFSITVGLHYIERLFRPSDSGHEFSAARFCQVHNYHSKFQIPNSKF